MTIDRKLVVGRLLRVALCGKKKGDSMNTKNNDPTSGISRRKFLEAIRSGVVALGMPNALASRSAYAAQQSPSRRYVIREDRFGRIFPQLPPFAESSPELEA